MIKLFISNLSKYTEGELLGEWITLPSTKKDIKDLFKRINLKDDEEYFIPDYECDIKGLVDEYSSIYELNEQAKLLENLSQDEKDLACSIMEYWGCKTINEALSLDIIMMKLKYNDLDLYKNIGHTFVEKFGINTGDEFTSRYFDYDAIGKDVDIIFTVDEKRGIAYAESISVDDFLNK